MRILLHNTFADGGAAVLMLRLHSALAERGHDSRICCRKGNLQLPDAKRLEFCQSSFGRPARNENHVGGRKVHRMRFDIHASSLAQCVITYLYA